MPSELPVYAPYLKPAVLVVLLAVLWSWESVRPFLQQFGRGRDRLQHAGRNLAITIFNAAVLALAFSAALLAVTQWTAARELGLLSLAPLPPWAHWGAALLLLDGWLYVWHRANHVVPFLWRFHRMHHTDQRMDVTTATRFHLGEHVLSSLLRLGLIPLLGVTLWQIMVYDVLVIANTLIHHANISLGRWDPLLRLVLVTPDMHKVHHSRERPETDSNYSTILSIWDRLAGSFCQRADCSTIRFGLDEFDAPQWQTVGGMLSTPLAMHSRTVTVPPQAALGSTPTQSQPTGAGGND